MGLVNWRYLLCLLYVGLIFRNFGVWCLAATFCGVEVIYCLFALFWVEG